MKYKGRIINLRQDTVALPDGREALRDVVEHPGGVGILPLDADGNAYMVRQYRSGVQDIVLEIPAGKLEYGEDPLECGRRELMEEIARSTMSTPASAAIRQVATWLPVVLWVCR